ncbi:Ham1 family protein [Enterococcus faecalis 13-SD-W-01]|nr:Ham1 family protein [Enterococcus faecalis 13-SD-W-01]
MREIIAASNNQGKIQELQKAASSVEIVSYLSYGEKTEAAETGESYLENALIKAETVGKFLQRPVMGDDGGLELAAFPNHLGLYTARELSSYKTDTEKNEYILKLLKGKKDRTCVLRAALAYYRPGKEPIQIIEKLVGEIALEQTGTNGYGFDSIIWIPEKNRTLGEMTLEERNHFSPRIRAFRKLLRRLEHV